MVRKVRIIENAFSVIVYPSTFIPVYFKEIVVFKIDYYKSKQYIKLHARCIPVTRCNLLHVLNLYRLHVSTMVQFVGPLLAGVELVCSVIPVLELDPSSRDKDFQSVCMSKKKVGSP